MTSEITILNAAEMSLALDDLAEILCDCVAGGASVNFMDGYTLDEARAFFRGVADHVARGEILILAARSGARIVGTVQLQLQMPPNQQHRADVKKLLVHRDARGMGIGKALMTRVENEARIRNRMLLMLDTNQGSEAESIYRKSGWQELGTVPGYAYWPDGRVGNTVFFWKRLVP